MEDFYSLELNAVESFGKPGEGCRTMIDSEPTRSYGYLEAARGTHIKLDDVWRALTLRHVGWTLTFCSTLLLWRRKCHMESYPPRSRRRDVHMGDACRKRAGRMFGIKRRNSIRSGVSACPTVPFQVSVRTVILFRFGVGFVVRDGKGFPAEP